MVVVDPAALAKFLVSHGVQISGPLTLTLIGGGKSNLTYAVSDGANRWVLRRPPLGGRHVGAHDVLREHRVMHALADSAVPVPRMVASGADAEGVPFFVMEHVDGTVLRNRELVEGLTAETRRHIATALVDTLADLHAVDPVAVGLAQLGEPNGYLSRQLARWHRQYHAVSSRHTARVDELAAGLTASMPATSAAGIVHGDFRLDNVVTAPDGSIAAVLDWEMATLGDPLADLGMLVIFWDEIGQPWNPITDGLTAFPDFGGKAEVVARYADRRELDQRSLDSLGWYLAFCQFKLAVILEQIAVRHASGQTLGAGFDGVDRMVDRLLEQCTVPHDDSQRSFR